MSQSDFTDPFLKERYGIKNQKWPAWVTPAVITALLGGGWLGWSANHYSKPETRAELISFRVVNDQSISIRYSVTFRTNSIAHKCLLIARDFSANVVGEVTDTFPAGVTEQSREVLIPTRVAGVNAAIDRCSP